MIKILYSHFANDFNGGSDRSLFELVRRLKMDGVVDPILILKRNDPYVEQYSRLKIKVYESGFVSPPARLDIKRWMLFLMYFIPSIVFVVSIIFKEKPSIVHVNTSLNLQSAIAAKLCKRKLIWHVREYSESRLFWFLTKCISLLSDIVIVISAFIKDRKFAGNEKCCIIENAVDIEGYRCDIDRREDSIIELVMPARIEAWKGQMLAVEAINILKKHDKLPLKEIRLKIVGSPAKGKEEYEQSLKNFIMKNNLGGMVEVHGYEKDIYRSICDADVLLQCSITPEPFGRTVVEAMSLGTVVIASDAGAAPSILNSGDLGFLFEAGKKESLAAVLIRVFNLTSIEKEKVIVKAKNKAKNYYDINRLTAQMHQVYISV